MGKNLLITLGCSYTEGMGCYDYSKFPKNKTVYSDNISNDLIQEQFNRFHEYGYPNRLGKKLGVSKVINMGVSGASTSGIIKKFFELFWNNPFSEYDKVFVFFWIPHSNRFSFYNNGKIENIVINTDFQNNKKDELSKSYLTFIEDFPLDFVHEQVFYLKVISSYCKSLSFQFLWFLDDTFFGKSILNHFPLDNWIGIKGKEISDKIYYENSPYINKACAHPNELGYEYYADKFYEKIKNNYSDVINSNSDLFDWEYI